MPKNETPPVGAGLAKNMSLLGGFDNRDITPNPKKNQVRSSAAAGAVPPLLAICEGRKPRARKVIMACPSRHASSNRGGRAMSKCLSYALDLGLPAFPCWDTPANKKTDKTPLTKNGFYDAVTDPAKIREMFTRPCLVGVPTGSVSGVDVLDVDPRNGGRQWYEENKGKLPATHAIWRPAFVVQASRWASVQHK